MRVYIINYLIMEIKKLIILGAGGHGHVLEEIAADYGFKVSFWNDDKSKTSKSFG